MRVMLIIMADIMALVAALLAVNEYHALRRRATFTIPFTDKLIARGVIAPGRREHILREDLIVHWVGIGLSVAVWLMLSAFFAGVSGYIVFPAAAAALLFLIRPGLEESDEREMLLEAVDRLDERERRIITLRFGLRGRRELTQKQVADLMGISQSYISRLEKRIILHLRRELGKLT